MIKFCPLLELKENVTMSGPRFKESSRPTNRGAPVFSVYTSAIAEDYSAIIYGLVIDKATKIVNY